MRSKTFLPVTLGLLLALGSPAYAQDDLPAEESKDKPAAKTGDGAPSPDDILEQMGGGAEGEPAVDADANPALLEEGQFEAGRDIFENIFKGTAKEGGPVAEGLPGMRIEEVTLSGVMTGAFGTVALFLAKDKQIYAARENQRFSNGRLANIAKDKVVFEQEVIDEFGKKRPPIIKEVQLHRNVKQKGRGQ